jgi:hypothetical protein
MAMSISVTELARNLSNFLARVAYRQEHFRIRKGNRIMAELRPVPGCLTLGDFESLLKTLPKLSEEDAEAFEKDLAEIRRAAADDKGRNPWDY